MAELVAQGETPDVLFWVGCSGSFDDRAKKITKAVDSDDGTVETNVLGPRARYTSLDGHSLAAASRENFFSILCRLLVEAVLGGHGHDTRARAELCRGSDRVLQLAATRQQNGVKRRGLRNGDVGTGQDAVAANFHRNLGQIREGLAGEGEHGGTVGAGEGGDECSSGFLWVSRAHD